MPSSTLERLALLGRQRARAPGLAVAGDDDGLALGGELAGRGADLLAHADARGAEPLEAHAHDHLVVLLAKLAAEVDGDPREHEVPGVGDPLERPLDPLVAVDLTFVFYLALVYFFSTLPYL